LTIGLVIINKGHRMTNLVEKIVVPIVIGIMASGATIYVSESNRQEKENVETTLRYLLTHKEEWKLRSYSAIKQYFGDAYSDEELKRHLISAGALRFPDNENPDKYWWGLTSKNLDRLK